MALSRIWSAFIIIAIVVAGIKCFVVDGQRDIFSRMVTGKSDDVYNYYAIGSVSNTRFSTIDSFAKGVEAFAFKRKDKPEDANTLITDNLAADSVKILKEKCNRDTIVKLVDFLSFIYHFISSVYIKYENQK